ncbi:unnamed protein product [Rotaria magnacalcarata]|uniref:Uncharacterized protein n=2 Tax=Rotaria magnacalcarata TaxID=392030 RepID=A0A8S2N8U8_9BILA|nr:unnamed protein product [Rotaria magnacalcarata]
MGILSCELLECDDIEEARKQYYQLYKLYELEHYQGGYATTRYYVTAVLHLGLQGWLAFDKEHTLCLLCQISSILTSLEENLSEDEYFELIQTIEQDFDVLLSQSEIFYLPLIAALFITGGECFEHRRRGEMSTKFI